MRALVVDRSVPSSLRLGDVPDPVPGPGQVLVDVRHTSLNRGEITQIRQDAEPGAVLGWDAAGIVVAPAAGGSGPPPGTRVAGFGPAGGWAQRRAVDVRELAVVPPGVDLAAAAALPVAGVSALRALRAAGSLLGRRVLVTGASGGVGRFAVQLAALDGAHVVASVGSPERGAGLADLGAEEVVVGLDEVTRPVHAVIENVGGPYLVRAFELLVPGGSVQSIGWTSTEPAEFGQYATVGPAKSLISFTMGAAIGRDLALLLGLVASGRLSVEIGWRGAWDRVGEAVTALLDRTVRGKAVLDVT